MTQKIEITCGEGPEAYQVVLTAGSLKTFIAASRDQRTKGKSGEPLVAAFIEASRYDGVNKVERFEGLKQIERLKNGKRNDGANGEPALLEYGHGSELVAESHYIDGKRNDSRSGEPSLRIYYASGGIGMEDRYQDDKRNDGPNGEPAMQKFDQKGDLSAASSYVNGELMKEFTTAEIQSYNRPGKEKAAEMMATAFPGLRVL